MDIESVYQQALHHLEEGRFREARDLGHRLLEWRFSGAFEILARAFRGEGQLPVAITVLENGTEQAPQVWSLWLQLGNYRSEAGDLDGALAAYSAARGCPDVDHCQVDLNEGILRERFGNPTAALELFEAVFRRTTDRELKLVALTHRLTTLISCDRLTEALLELGEANLHDADNAELLSKLAFQCLDRNDHSNALNLAKQALGLKRSGEVARILRLLEGQPSDRSRLFEITLKVNLHDDVGGDRFTKISRVYAEDSKEAVELALEFEPQDVQPDLEVERIEELEGPSTEPRGVEWSSDLRPTVP